MTSEGTHASLGLVDRLLSERTDAEDEARILEIVSHLSTEELNALLTDERADRLVQALDNHWFGPNRRDALMELVTVRRAHELGLHARANLVYSLQTGRTSSEQEERIADLFCAVTGEELTHFKNIINLRNDHHDLEDLVFVDIDSVQVRQRILDHIAEQARGFQLDEAKVLCDIDDTVFCKLHDRRYPRGTLYPGVLAFQEALDQGPHDEPRSQGDLTFVTARPMDFFGLLENHSRASLRQAGVSDLSVMSGSLRALLTHESMADKKVVNVTHYVQLYPEYRMIFLGDSGQGDVQVGEQLWQKFPETVDAVFIHDVTGIDEDERTRRAEHKIWVHDTYVGAATKAHQLGLITQDCLRSVVVEAREELGRIEWDDEQQADAMMQLFARDFALAETSLSRHA